MRTTTFTSDSNKNVNPSNEIQLMNQISQSQRESSNINNYQQSNNHFSQPSNGTSQQLWLKLPSKSNNNNNNISNPLGYSRTLSHVCESETEFNNNNKDVLTHKNSEIVNNNNNFNSNYLNINDQQFYSHYDESSSSYLGNNDMMLQSGSPSKSRRYQQQQYQQSSQFRMNIFYTQNEEMFQTMRNELDALMGKFDEKVIEALGKREYELLKSFRVTMDRMTADLANTHRKLANFHKEAETDIKVVCLERQLKFFRENCEELSKSNLELKAQTAELKNSMEVLTAEVKIAKQAHFKAQQRLTELLEIQAMKQPTNNDNSINNATDTKIPLEKESKLSRQFKHRDSLITALRVIDLQENPHQAAFVIEQLVIDKLGGRDTLIEDLKTENQSKKRQIKQLLGELRTGGNNTPEIRWNPIREIFLKGIREMQSGKQSSLNKTDANNNEFDSEQRMEIVQRMFASNEFLEAVNALLFQQKCCNYSDCKFNILPGGNEQNNKNKDNYHDDQARSIEEDNIISNGIESNEDDYEAKNNFLTSITTTNGYNNRTKNTTTATATKTSTNQNTLQATGWLYNKRWSQVDAKAWGKVPIMANGYNQNKQISTGDEGKETKQVESLHGKKIFSSNVREIISSGGQRVRSYSLSHGSGTEGDINRNNKNNNNNNRRISNNLLNSSLNKTGGQEKNTLSYYQDNNVISKHISNVINEFQKKHPGKREDLIELGNMQERHTNTNNSYQRKVDKVIFKNNKIF